MNSYSTGNLLGDSTVGITGREAGKSKVVLNITGCYSTGVIRGYGPGGSCAPHSGHSDGRVCIQQSYSTGDILGNALHAGGIVGINAGIFRGDISIREC